jgi:adenosylmethionine-8-amino-7-oxononanoate aminotransferase
MDLRAPDGGYLANVGPRLSASFRESHVLLRPLGNTIYVLPPYCVTREDLKKIYDAIGAAVDGLVSR